MIDLDWIRELIDLVDESEIDTLEVSRFATRVRISKSPPTAGAAPPATAPSPTAGGSPSPTPGGPAGGGAAPGESSPATAAAEEGEEPAGGVGDVHEITSPMVGTFYRAPAPDAPPYVEEGERVQEGQTLCILEAMKLMNELESEVSGVIREICVENSEAVEYGQALFRIDTSA